MNLLNCNTTFNTLDSILIIEIVILEWTTSLDTSSRTLFVREGGRMCVGMSTSRRTSSYVITSDCY